MASPVLAAAIPVKPLEITAAPSPAAGHQVQSGAAAAGPGPGAGSSGSGLGGGGGTGTGGGGAANLGGTPPDWTGGEIKRSDYPKAAREAGAQGTVATEITVGLNGRAIGCRITRTSGSALLDQTTCQLILKRFRFRPARDRSGRPVVETVEYDQEWVFTRIDPE